jgi:hypothetical protein
MFLLSAETASNAQIIEMSCESDCRSALYIVRNPVEREARVKRCIRFCISERSKKQDGSVEDSDKKRGRR